MGANIKTIIGHGMNGINVEVECRITNGLPAISIVGSAGNAINESKERVRNAILSIGFNYPRRRITLNLAPGDIPKNGASLDLAIAVAILAADGQIKDSRLNNYIFIGELGLDGSLRPVRGLIGMILSADKSKNQTFVIPKSNISQVSGLTKVNLITASNLLEVCDHLNNRNHIPPAAVQHIKKARNTIDHDFDDIVGQEFAKRCLQIAAAGGHNVLMSGPPGAGKTMLAKAFPGILPDINHDEALQITHLHSLVSNEFETMVSERPFRSPHHSSSLGSIVGGGKDLRPGEISLSHNGVLFLDELPEFNRLVLESLRQPLEDHSISISRLHGNTTYPADFILLAAANPCPCGNLGTQDRTCTCSTQQIFGYQRKLSGPLLDRIDLFVQIESVKHDQLANSQSLWSSLDLKHGVVEARLKQQKRFGEHKLNSRLSGKEILNNINLPSEVKQLLDVAAGRLELSTRGYLRTIKVSRTIADLDNSDNILVTHMAEALQYRQKPNAFSQISA